MRTESSSCGRSRGSGTTRPGAGRSRRTSAFQMLVAGRPRTEGARLSWNYAWAVFARALFTTFAVWASVARSCASVSRAARNDCASWAWVRAFGGGAGGGRGDMTGWLHTIHGRSARRFLTGRGAPRSARPRTCGTCLNWLRHSEHSYGDLRDVT